jgi:hypothetical protein
MVVLSTEAGCDYFHLALNFLSLPTVAASQIFPFLAAFLSLRVDVAAAARQHSAQ